MIVMNGKSGIRKMYEKSVRALHYITLHYITLHYITLHYISKTWMEKIFKDDTRRLRFVSFWL